VKRTVKKAPAKAPVKKVSQEEYTRVELLVARRDICALQLQATEQAQRLMAANNELAAFERTLIEKYGVTPPFEILEDLTIAPMTPS
jgi:hypothetical protein